MYITNVFFFNEYGCNRLPHWGHLTFFKFVSSELVLVLFSVPLAALFPILLLALLLAFLSALMSLHWALEISDYAMNISLMLIIDHCLKMLLQKKLTIQGFHLLHIYQFLRKNKRLNDKKTGNEFEKILFHSPESKLTNWLDVFDSISTKPDSITSTILYEMLSQNHTAVVVFWLNSIGSWKCFVILLRISNKRYLRNLGMIWAGSI